MVIRPAFSRAAAGLFALSLGVAASGEAFAQANVLKECGSQYQTAKAANELNGQSWQDFLKACRTRLSEGKGAETAKPAEATKPAETAKPAEAPAAAPAPAPVATPAPAAAPPTAAEAKPAAKPAAKGAAGSVQARQKKCAADWKANKVELRKADSKLTWPKYWSACNKRLKAAGE